MDCNKNRRNHDVEMDKAILLFLAGCILFVMMFMASSCSPRIIEHTIIQHDTTKVVKVDSIWKYEKDSVFVKEKGDTIYKYVERIRYRDRYKIDTLLKFHIDSVYVDRVKEVTVEKKLNWIQKLKLGSFWFFFAGFAALLVWTFRKVIFKISV